MKILVAGALANKPRYGGEAWVRLAWLEGLRRLDVDVRFVERLDATDPDGGRVRWFDEVLRSHAPDVPATLLAGIPRGSGDGGAGRTLAGESTGAVLDYAADAELLVNVSGHLRPGDPVFEAARRRAYVDLDPGFTQIWHARGIGDLGVERHQAHFTVGWNVGSRDCPIPTGGVRWLPLRQPVVLDRWPVAPLPGDARLTTVASWRGAYGPIELGGRRLGLKVHEFRKVLDLPRRAVLPLEIALDIHPADAADRARLVEQGWHLVDPDEEAGTPDAFRRYVRESTGELSVAQGVYVETASGWFSDRSARYLATGRPVVVQDTGLAPDLPRDEGILAFRTPDEAAEAIRALADDPERHAAAARRVAERHFDARTILAGVLERALDVRPEGRGAPGGSPRRDPVPSREAPAGPRPEPTGARSSPSAGRTGRPRRVLVSGMIGSVPGQGGATWAVLQYVLGLRRLGWDVHFVEEIERAEIVPAGTTDLTRSRNWRYLRDVARSFDLEGRVSLLLRQGSQTAGRRYQDLLRLARRADLVVNLSGRLRDADLLRSIPVRLYVDLDPVFTQLWHRNGRAVGLERHTHFATVGLSLGRSTCPAPTCGLDWIPTLPPVVLDRWPPAARRPERDAWTTVSHWRGYGCVELGGRRLGQKAHSFRRLYPLPVRSGDRFEVALAIHPDERDDLDALRRNGWSLVDPERVAGGPGAYGAFVASSAGELGVAKAGYVDARSGWFSDRSACYLASGRPVVAQETGFSNHLPVGEGLLAFSDLDGAREGLARARADYPRHAAAARAFAERHLASDRVLSTLLRELDR